jgi:hypothetical protein
VTRLGEFSPLGRFLTFGHFFKSENWAKILGFFISNKELRSMYIVLTERVDPHLGRFSSQNYLVALATAFTTKKT